MTADMVTSMGAQSPANFLSRDDGLGASDGWMVNGTSRRSMSFLAITYSIASISPCQPGSNGHINIPTGSLKSSNCPP